MNKDLSGIHSWFYNTIFSVVDIETTGFSVYTDEIVELAIVKIANGVIVKEWSTIIKPSNPLKLKTIKIHGLDNDTLMLAPEKGEVKQIAHDLLVNTTFVEHSQRRFDSLFLEYFFGEKIWNEEVNTLRLARDLFPQYPNYKLSYLCEMNGIALGHHHYALDDATSTAKLFIKFMNLEIDNEKRLTE